MGVLLEAPPPFEKTAHSIPVTLRWMARGDQEGLL